MQIPRVCLVEHHTLADSFVGMERNKIVFCELLAFPACIERKCIEKWVKTATSSRSQLMHSSSSER
jgi:hypothetical protein